MVRKIRAKLVLQLRNQGLSGRAISLAQGMSRHSIQAVIDAADQLGLGWEDVAEKSEGEVYLTLFPGRGVRESVFAQPDWVQVHRELARVVSWRYKIDPTGKSLRLIQKLSSPLAKIFCFSELQISLYASPSRPTKGAFRNVPARGGDAVDGDGDADGGACSVRQKRVVLATPGWCQVGARRADDGGKKAWLTEESAYKP